MPRSATSCIYDVRISKGDYTPYTMAKLLSQICKRWVFQLERGEKTGYEHWQMRVSMRKQCTQAAATKLFMEAVPDLSTLGYYIKPTSKEKADQYKYSGNAFYVMKLQTRIDGPWKDTDDDFQYIPRQFRVTPRPWQQQVMDSAGYDSRHVNVLADQEGGMGKSTCLGLAACTVKGAYYIPVYGDVKEMVTGVCDMLIARQDHHPTMFLFDLPRSFPHSRYRAMFEAMEYLKLGMVADFRYKYRQWRYDSPAIWVFTNDPYIDLHRFLSGDRVHIWDYVNEESPLVRRNHAVTIQST